MATPAKLRLRALRRLNLVQAGQSAPGEDDAAAQDVYTALYGELDSQGSVAWSITDEVPSQFVEPLVQLIAHDLAPDYGVPYRVDRDAVKGRILYLMDTGESGYPLQTQYF